MQHILQVYTLCTCHETTQVGPPTVCFDLWGHNTSSDGNVIEQLINSPFANLNFMGALAFMLVAHQWPFQMLKQFFPCHEGCE